MSALLAVGLGAGLGSLARFTLSVSMFDALGAGFPWWTLMVNLLGAFLIGFFAELTKPPGPLDFGAHGRSFLLTGFCGGFTTFSIFSLETLLLWHDGQAAAAALYVAASLITWLAMVGVGIRTGRRVERTLRRRNAA